MGLREYLQQIERESPDQILRIKEEVDPRYEITALVTAMERKRQNQVLWFERVKGSKFPVVVNVGGSRQRIAEILDCSPKDILAGYLRRIEEPIPPIEVETGPVKDVIYLGDDANLLDFPQIVHHEADGGPYIAAGMTFAKDPDTGMYNVCVNRLMIKGPRKTGVLMTPGRHLRDYYVRAAKKGQPLELAVAIGVPLEYMLGAMYQGSIHVDELHIMGAVGGKPVPMVRCETLDLSVPADAEIVVEGRIPPYVLEPEGPFGEFTGYAAGVQDREIFEVTAITHRRDALYQDITPGRLELFYVSMPHEAVLYSRLRHLVPTLKSMHMTAPFTLFMSIAQDHEGQGKNAIFSALGAEFYTKVVVVVDEDIDVHDQRQVLWAIATRAQPDRDVFIVPNALGAALDPSCIREGVSGKLGIDATAKPSLREYAPRNTVPQELLERMEKGELFKPSI